MYTQAQYKVQSSEYLAGLEEEFYNGYSDLEIMDYTASIYKLITCGGQFITLKSDSKIIVEAVTEKFGITSDEYGQIYRKYFLKYH